MEPLEGKQLAAASLCFAVKTILRLPRCRGAQKRTRKRHEWITETLNLAQNVFFLSSEFAILK